MVFRTLIIIFAVEMEVIVMPIWAWILFYVLVLVMLVIDLKSFGKKGQHEVDGQPLRIPDALFLLRHPA